MHRLVIALTTLLALTAGTYLAGWILVFGASADRAAALVPANAAAYVNVYLQPSAGQQMNLSELIGRLPGFADEATLDDKVDQIAQNLLAGTGFDYRIDFKPWLGDQVAAATWADDEDPAVQRAVAIVDVKDPAAMESSLADLAERQGESYATETYRDVTLRVGTATSWAVVAQMLVVSDTVDAVRSVIDTQSGSPSLASLAEFRAAMDGIPTDHLAAAFVNVRELAAAGGDAEAAAGFTTIAAALVADADGLRLSGVAPRPTGPAEGTAAPAPAADGPSTLARWMPAGTVAEVAFFGLAGILADAEAAAAGTPLGEQLSTLRLGLAFGFGIDLDTDILPLLDGETGVALTGIDPAGVHGHLVLRPSDVDTAAAALERMAESFVDAGGSRTVERTAALDVTIVDVPQLGPVAYATVDDAIILGLSVDDVAAAATARADGTTLAASARYEAAFEAIGGRAGSEAYADVPALVEGVGLADTLPDDARAILSRLGTFAATVRASGDHIEFHAVLTIDDAGAD